VRVVINGMRANSARIFGMGRNNGIACLSAYVCGYRTMRAVSARICGALELTSLFVDFFELPNQGIS
jgi:hypothetical protein